MNNSQSILRISYSSVAMIAGLAFIASLGGSYLGSSRHEGGRPQYSVCAAQKAGLINKSVGRIAQIAPAISQGPNDPTSASRNAGQTSLAAFVSNLTHGALRFVSQASGPDGVTAVSLAPAGPANAQQIIGWVLPNNGGLLLGTLFDPDGNNQNLAFGQKLGLPTDPSQNPGQRQSQTPMPPAASRLSPDQIRQAMTHSGFSGFKEGSGPVHLTVFMDANCSVCHELWEELRQDHNWRKKFTINWIPVGAFKPSSLAMGASILAGGAKALDQNEVNFDNAGENGGIRGSSDDKWISAVQNNTQSWVNLVTKDGQQPGTPTIVIDDKQITVGLPSSTAMSAMTDANFP